ncbi:MAG: hypothetical protein IPF57_18775, partial [Gammaproteobacteria bacterium]|nr:hypothetical protein [Gammaproteobacteria bacterium]
LAYFEHILLDAGGLPERPLLQRTAAIAMVLGAYGLFASFYLAGAYSIPRRFAIYPAELAHGAGYAHWGMLFAVLFLLGFLLYLADIGKRWWRVMAA